jgi:hypothetical protein
LRRISALGDPAHKANKDEKHDGSNGRRDDLSKNAATRKQTKLREQPASKDSADNTDYDVPDDAKAVTLDNRPR